MDFHHSYCYCRTVPNPIDNGEYVKNISTTKYEYINAIRGFAILGVVLVHSSQWVRPASDILSKIASEGARGVQLFYVASALTLFLSMASRKQQEERRGLLSYFIRRFFRIAPAFYCAIIIYTAYNGMSAHYWAPNGLEWWSILLTAFFYARVAPGNNYFSCSRWLVNSC